MKKEKNKETKKHNRLSSTFKNGAWVFLNIFGVYTFIYKLPYFIVLGFFIISTGFIFFPWLDNLVGLFKTSITTKNKWFIFIISLFLAAYLITPEETNYVRCILPIGLTIILWIGVIIYRKLKESSKK